MSESTGAETVTVGVPKPAAKPKTPNDWYYERTLAPKIKKIMKLCARRSLSFLAVVQIDPGKYGRTEAVTENIDVGMTLINTAAMAKTNVDIYVYGAARLVLDNYLAHGSLILSALGIDRDPERRKAGELPPAVKALAIQVGAIKAPAPVDLATEQPVEVPVEAVQAALAGKPVTFKDIPYAGEGAPEASNAGAADTPATASTDNGDDMPAFLRRAKPAGYDINADI